MVLIFKKSNNFYDSCKSDNCTDSNTEKKI